MAEGQSRFPAKALAGLAVIILLVGVAYARYQSWQDQRMGPVGRPTAENTETSGRLDPDILHRGMPQAKTTSSRLEAPEEDAEKDQPGSDDALKRKTRRTQKKSKRESKKDKYGIYRNEDGSIDHNKTPPMGG